MRMSRIFGLCGSILLAIAFVSPVMAQGPGPVDCGIDRFMFFNALSDSVPAGTQLTGHLSWDVGMFSHAGDHTPPDTFHHPTVTIYSSFPSITGDYYTNPPWTWYYNSTQIFPLIFETDSLLPNSSVSQGWTTTDITTLYTPGYDSSRTVSPLVIPAGATIQQTVTVKMALRDDRYTYPNPTTSVMGVGMGMSISGKCISISVLPAGAQTGCDSNGANWSIQPQMNPSLNTEYTATIVLEVSNPNGYPVNSKPSTNLEAAIYHQPYGVTAPTVTVIDPNDTSLGSVVLSLDESVEWHPRVPDLRFDVLYPAVWEEATDTTPPVITPTITGTMGNNGWYVSPVTVTWSVVDPESGISSSTGCGATTLSNDTSGTTLTCSATNGAGMSNSASVTIRIDQTSPIIIGLSVDNGVLWPPNHKMVHVTVSVTASDSGSGLASEKIISVTSNEPIDGLGDGDTSPDWVITGNLTVDLRSERSGTGSGRVYTITVQCTDQAGNSSTKNVTVKVPHDQGK